MSICDHGCPICGRHDGWTAGAQFTYDAAEMVYHYTRSGGRCLLCGYQVHAVEDASSWTGEDFDGGLYRTEERASRPWCTWLG